MNASTERAQASSRPMSRLARKLAESSEEIPATAGLSLPALRGDAAVPPTKALPVVGEDEASLTQTARRRRVRVSLPNPRVMT